MMIYKYTCVHNLPDRMEISVEAEDEEEAYGFVFDEFFTHFESNAGIELIKPTMKNLMLVPTIEQHLEDDEMEDEMEEEMNWDTTEVDLWLSNDQGLYLELQGVLESTRNDKEAADTLSEMGIYVPNVDKNEVDWLRIVKDAR